MLSEVEKIIKENTFIPFINGHKNYNRSVQFYIYSIINFLKRKELVKIKLDYSM